MATQTFLYFAVDVIVVVVVVVVVIAVVDVTVVIFQLHRSIFKDCFIPDEKFWPRANQCLSTISKF